LIDFVIAAVSAGVTLAIVMMAIVREL